ncbi:hypothetical protein M3Y94_00238800 [Aphelenchoides besseyi]|nr:hypothetical protein M3Y94_00238800 [Aphelenchoides besseyi]
MNQSASIISKLEVEYGNSKLRFDEWIKNNEAMSQTDEYVNYVKDFRTWESEMLARIQEERNAMTRRPIGEVPMLPTQNVDEQLNQIMQNIPMNKFICALLEWIEQDHSIFDHLSNVVNKQTEGTGYYNSLLPQQSILPQIVSIPPTYHQPPTTFLYTGNQANPLNQTGIVNYQQPQYSQPTVHGMIPAGWTVDEPVQRVRHQPVPERQILPKLPFKDFSQT